MQYRVQYVGFLTEWPTAGGVPRSFCSEENHVWRSTMLPPEAINPAAATSPTVRGLQSTNDVSAYPMGRK
jgi:hypothetical protein